MTVDSVVTTQTEQVASSATEGVATTPLLDLCDFSRAELEKILDEKFAAPRFRATQIFNWIYRRGAKDVASMTDINRELREKLMASFFVPTPKIVERQISTDGTRKYLFEVDGGDKVEAVMIKQPNRMTLCVSSQVGCAMACAFCRTGTMGLKRHLRSSEILQQFLGVIEDAKNFGDTFQNIVFMGMGEPMHNFDNLIRALTVLRDKEGFLFSGRKITVSTVGHCGNIEKFSKTGLDINLAVSLNATTDEVREPLMPITKKYPIADLIKTLRAYPLKPRASITIEYVMLGGINDTDEDLKRLPHLLKGIQCKVNLIPYNNNADLGINGEKFKTPSRNQVFRWHNALNILGLKTTIRWSRGKDIDAACGQLATQNEEKKRAKEKMSLSVINSDNVQPASMQ